MPLKSKSKLVGIPTADGKFRCIWCPKTYCKSKHARRHMLLHTGERPYDCPHCTMNFTRADIRKRHVIKCAQKQEDKEEKEEPVVEAPAPVESSIVDPIPEYIPEYLEEPQFPYYFFEGQESHQNEEFVNTQNTEEFHVTQQQHIPQQEVQQHVQHVPQMPQQHVSQQLSQQLSQLPQMSQQQLSQLPQMPQQQLPQQLSQLPQSQQQQLPQLPQSKFPLLQQHPTLYAHDDHVNLSNLIDSLSQSALPLHYQLLHSDSDSIESISETSASDEGEYFEPLNWSLEGLM